MKKPTKRIIDWAPQSTMGNGRLGGALKPEDIRASLPKSPTKRKPTKRVVKGWAVTEPRTQIMCNAGWELGQYEIYRTRALAMKQIKGNELLDVSVIPIEITYHLPPKTT